MAWGLIELVCEIRVVKLICLSQVRHHTKSTTNKLTRVFWAFWRPWSICALSIGLLSGMSILGRSTGLEIYVTLRFFTNCYLKMLSQKWSYESTKMVIFDWKWQFSNETYPESFWGLRFWYSTSSTVQTAPLTFSTRTKHLCKDKLWRTAFFQVAAFFLKFFRKKSLSNNFEIL